MDVPIFGSKIVAQIGIVIRNFDYYRRISEGAYNGSLNFQRLIFDDKWNFQKLL